VESARRPQDERVAVQALERDLGGRGQVVVVRDDQAERLRDDLGVVPAKRFAGRGVVLAGRGQLTHDGEVELAALAAHRHRG
jgi:hypothetical protein